MDLRDKRDLYNGFGDGLSRAFEFAITPVVFGLVGHLLDGWMGISPALTITLALFAVAGGFVRMWYAYDAQMKVHEASGPWSRRAA
jgi:hypothetical protein